MKKLFSVIAVFATILVQNVFAQEDTKQTAGAELLAHYYNIKNALVAGDAVSAALAADAFINTVDCKIISEDNIHVLVADASAINPYS